MTDLYDTHDENNTPEENGWDGEYPGQVEEDLEAAWDEFCDWCDMVEADDEIPF